jgi:cytochrome c oxidase assembly factor CtaG
VQIVSVDPVLAVLLLLVCGLYVRALRVLARRRPHGLRVPAWQQACWWIGIVLLAIGLLGPAAAYEDRLLSAHMAQHQLIADLAVPFLLLGLRAPLLLFYLPRPVLVLLARRHGLRRVFRFLRQPLVALPLYVLTMYAWHYGSLFEGAAEHPLLHALQHEAFFAANLLLWWPVIEPARQRMGGELWKIGYLFAARMSTMFLGMLFVFSRGVLYTDVYGTGAREGIAARADQQTAGGLMITLDIVIMVIAACWFFWLAAREHDATGAYTGGATSRNPGDAAPRSPRDAAATSPPPPADSPPSASSPPRVPI